MKQEMCLAIKCIFCSRPWDKDRYMSPDINAVKELLKDEKIWNAAKHHMEKYHTSQVSNISNVVFGLFLTKQ